MQYSFQWIDQKAEKESYRDLPLIFISQKCPRIVKLHPMSWKNSGILSFRWESYNQNIRSVTLWRHSKVRQLIRCQTIFEELVSYPKEEDLYFEGFHKVRWIGQGSWARPIEVCCVRVPQDKLLLPWILVKRQAPWDQKT